VYTSLELDDTLADAHSALGWAALFEWDWPASEQHFQRALERNPSLAHAHSGYGYQLSSRGHHDEAIAEARRAVELAPFDLVQRGCLAELYRFARRYGDEEDEVRNILEMDPTHRVGNASLGFVYRRLGRHEEAIDLFERQGGPPAIASALRDALSREGPQGYRREVARIVRALPVIGNFHWFLAHLYAQAGERDEAFAELELAYTSRDGDLAFLRVWSGWDPIRDDPRFDELVRRIGIPES
jgi:tetratricopeptide (TPR) repeat protein